MLGGSPLLRFNPILAVFPANKGICCRKLSGTSRRPRKPSKRWKRPSPARPNPRHLTAIFSAKSRSLLRFVVFFDRQAVWRAKGEMKQGTYWRSVILRQSELFASTVQELQAKKMDEEALFAEMEVTGAAFEDLQAQNGTARIRKTVQTADDRPLRRNLPSPSISLTPVQPGFWSSFGTRTRPIVE